MPRRSRLTPLDKKTLSERDICTKFITPAIERAGWDQAQWREEVFFTDGRITMRNKVVSRGQRKRADYILYYKPNLPIAVIEAKDNHHSVGAGMQQALEYAEMLDVPFVFSSNGDGFLEHDRTGLSPTLERELRLEDFPSPQELWFRYCQWKGITPEVEPVITWPYHPGGGVKEPRYYQVNAINRTLEAIARGQSRLLLVMATGTGKTYTAFQISWRLLKSGAKKRVLFLADRNILVDQARINDFKPFGGALTKVVHREVDMAYEVYLALYQSLSSAEESKDIFRQYPRDFFDLVIVDECHRGSADDDSAWRRILEYFESATQIGLTATPKETKDVSTRDYFGDPVYTYSLKQGIEDGFLAPYKVVRIDLDKDLGGWRPEAGQLDKYGREIEDRVYGQRDYDGKLILEQRTERVAQKITEFLKATDRMAKTIVFCENIDHAERMRSALARANADLCAQNRRYVMRIVAEDPVGLPELDNFIAPASPYPVIVTTSKLLSTGVDAQTCKLIVLDQNIHSMTEFKQIIGRGTRIRQDYGKHTFTLMDFRRATELFADPAFDGDPEQVYSPRGDESPVPPEEPAPARESSPGERTEGLRFPREERRGGGPVRYVVGDVEVSVVAERIQYFGSDGKLFSEDLRDYTRKKVLQEYPTLDAFLQRWTQAESKGSLLDELAGHGVIFEELEKMVGPGHAPFDAVCHIVFGQPALTRKQRVARVRQSNVLSQYSVPARAVLEALLDQFADGALEELEERQGLRLPPLAKLGTPLELIKRVGGPERYDAAIRELEEALYKGS